MASFNQVGDRFIRFPELRSITGFSRTTTWRKERESSFPSRCQISSGTVGWRLSEVMAWLENRERVCGGAI